MAFDRVIKFRVSREEERRLEALAQLMDSNSSAVLRQLIRTAQIVNRPAVEASPIERVS